MKSKRPRIVIRIVERAVRQNVGFDSLKNAEFSAVRLVEPVRLSLLLRDLLERKPACIMR